MTWGRSGQQCGTVKTLVCCINGLLIFTFVACVIMGNVGQNSYKALHSKQYKFGLKPARVHSYTVHRPQEFPRMLDDEADPADDDEWSTAGYGNRTLVELPKVLRDIEVLLGNMKGKDVIDYKSWKTTLSRIWNALKLHTEAGFNKSVAALMAGITNMKLVRKLEISKDLVHLEKLEFLPQFRNPCWVEPLWPRSFYRHPPFISPRHMWRIGHIYQARLRRQDVTWRLRCLPAFFLAGFPKCATTDLYERLSQHPALPQSHKEPNWWSRRQTGFRQREKPRVSFDNYLATFDGAGNKLAHNYVIAAQTGREHHEGLVFDASASTVWDFTLLTFTDKYKDIALENLTLQLSDLPGFNISRILPHSKTILLLRNPVDRAYSGFLYFHEDLKKKSSEKIQDLFRKEVQEQIRNYEMCHKRTYNVTLCAYWLQTLPTKVRVYIGMYHVYIEQWLKLFPRRNLLVLQTENYSQNPVGVLNNISRFLQIDEPSIDPAVSTPAESEHDNRRRWNAPTMSHDTRLLLEQFYRPFNVALAKLLGDNKYLWEDNA